MCQIKNINGFMSFRGDQGHINITPGHRNGPGNRGKQAQLILRDDLQNRITARNVFNK